MEHTYKNGIDVSEHDMTVDWSTVKASGCGFAILRCGFGSSENGREDYYFERNASECERLNIPYGVYLYSYASSYNGGVDEAEHALYRVGRHNLSLPIFIDVEEQALSAFSSSVCSGFCDRIQQSGYGYGIYASESWWQNYLLIGALSDAAMNGARWVAKWSHYEPEIPWDIWQTGNIGFGPYSFDGNRMKVDQPCEVLQELVNRTISGEFGNDCERVAKLGPLYNIVQEEVNRTLV